MHQILTRHAGPTPPLVADLRVRRLIRPQFIGPPFNGPHPFRNPPPAAYLRKVRSVIGSFLNARLFHRREPRLILEPG